MTDRKAYFDAFGERLYAPEMIDWLEGKPQDVWVDVVPHLNWDSAEGVLLWMVEQEQCELSVAAWVFWATDIESVVRGGYYSEWRRSDSGKIASTILRNLGRGFYRSRRLRFAEPYRGDLARTVTRWRGMPDKLKAAHSDLKLPPALLGPFKGRTPLPFPHWRAQHNPHLWDLFMGLGTSIGARPGWANLYNIYLLSDWRIVLGGECGADGSDDRLRPVDAAIALAPAIEPSAAGAPQPALGLRRQSPEATHRPVRDRRRPHSHQGR